MNITSIEGTGIITQPVGCDLFIGQLTLPASHQFECKADWDGPGIVVPQAPALLLPEEVSYVKQHRELLEDVWDAREDSRKGPTAVTAPMTMPQLQQQVETKILPRKWICSGIVAGSTAAFCPLARGLGGEAVKRGEYTSLGRGTEFNYGTYFGKDLPKLDAGTFMSWPYGIQKRHVQLLFLQRSSPAINADGTCGNDWTCERLWRQIYNMARFTNLVQRTSVTNWWDNGSQQIAYTRGNLDFIAFNDQYNTDLNQTIQTSLPGGTYCDVISGEKQGNFCIGKTATVEPDGRAFIQLPASEDDGVLAITVEVGAYKQFALTYINRPSDSRIPKLFNLRPIISVAYLTTFTKRMLNRTSRQSRRRFGVEIYDQRTVTPELFLVFLSPFMKMAK
ncbi:hypothetical protein B7P43_G17813 [Cryptotermes secundus]|uniref:alpha-amylase n=1 Tax=Cryptotermes secundus TaxID=105785 RepID=A0A2J7Q073_9NEOP|nr:hypothetical protein B7P43_G17813 [Cryptotermes secundus]